MFPIRSFSVEWMNSHEASKYLGFSEKSLKCWRECGYLKIGKHWQPEGEGINSQILYKVDLCKKEMDEWWGRDALFEN